MNKIVALLLVLLTSFSNLSLAYEPVTIKNLLPVGSTLHLTQALEIPKDRLYIYISHGKVAPIKNYNTVDIYQPYCMFYLYEETSQARQILPDQFKITKVVEWEGYYSRLNSPYLRVSGLNKMRMVIDDDEGSSTIMHATILSLRSDKQPEVKQLVCGHWDDQTLVEPLTLEEMKSALGDLILIIKIRG